jgi:hypothetical protein
LEQVYGRPINTEDFVGDEDVTWSATRIAKKTR